MNDHALEENGTIDAETDAQLQDDLQRLRNAKLVLKEAEAEFEAIETVVKTRMGNAAAIMLNGKAAVTWKQSADRTVIRWEEAFKVLADHVALATVERIIAENTLVKPGPRIFLVKK